VRSCGHAVMPIQRVKGLARRSREEHSKLTEVGRLHSHISWPISQPRRQPTLRNSTQNTPTSRRSKPLTIKLQELRRESCIAAATATHVQAPVDSKAMGAVSVYCCVVLFAVC
jgi:hypothetical protein